MEPIGADAILIGVHDVVLSELLGQERHSIGSPEVAREDECDRGASICGQPEMEDVTRAGLRRTGDDVGPAREAPTQAPDQEAATSRRSLSDRDPEGPPGIGLSGQTAQGAPDPAEIPRDGQHQAQRCVVPRRTATSTAALLACTDPGIVRSRIFRDVRPERWELPRGEKHPLHGGNLVDDDRPPGRVAEVSVDLSRCARGDE